MSLLEEALLLQRAAHDLMYLGMDGSPIYSDDLSRRNSEVYRLTTTLYNLALGAPRWKSRQMYVLRSWRGIVPRSLTMVKTTACAGGIEALLGYPWFPSFLFVETPFAYGLLWRGFDEPLADEGRSIIASWNFASLTAEQQEAVNEFGMWWIILIRGKNWRNESIRLKKDRNMRNFEDLQIAVAGTGYVGLSIATLLSQHHKVTAVDVIPERWKD